MTMKATPGPWVAETYGSKSVIEIKSLAVDAPPVVNWPGFDDSHRKWVEHFANAKLMAASHEMLDACKSALNFLGNRRAGVDPYYLAINEVIEKLENAIKKAQ